MVRASGVVKETVFVFGADQVRVTPRIGCVMELKWGSAPVTGLTFRIAADRPSKMKKRKTD
jgi:hypothetical protein